MLGLELDADETAFPAQHDVRRPDLRPIAFEILAVARDLAGIGRHGPAGGAGTHRAKLSATVRCKESAAVGIGRGRVIGRAQLPASRSAGAEGQRPHRRPRREPAPP